MTQLERAANVRFNMRRLRERTFGVVVKNTREKGREKGRKRKKEDVKKKRQIEKPSS